MTRYLVRAGLELHRLEEADRAEWDQFAASHRRSSFYQSWAWGDVERRRGWWPERLAVLRAREIIGGVQVLFKPISLGHTVAYAPRGPLVDLETVDMALARAMLFDGLELLGRERHAVCCRINPRLPASRAHWLTTCGAARSDGLLPSLARPLPVHIMRLDLKPGLTEVRNAFRADYRNRIRKAERRGVRIEPAQSLDDWRTGHELACLSALRHGVTPREWDHFGAIWDRLRDVCYSTMLLAKLDGQAIGVGLWVSYGTTAWHYDGGLNDAGRHHYAGYLLEWHGMRWAVDQGCRTYDLGGVAPPGETGHPAQGFSRFKRGFGAELVQWAGDYEVVFAPFWHTLLLKLLPRFRSDGTAAP